MTPIWNHTNQSKTRAKHDIVRMALQRTGIPTTVVTFIFAGVHTAGLRGQEEVAPPGLLLLKHDMRYQMAHFGFSAWAAFRPSGLLLSRPVRFSSCADEATVSDRRPGRRD